MERLRNDGSWLIRARPEHHLLPKIPPPDAMASHDPGTRPARQFDAPSDDQMPSLASCCRNLPKESYCSAQPQSARRRWLARAMCCGKRGLIGCGLLCPVIAPKSLAVLALLLPGIGRLFPTSLIVTADHPVSRLSGYGKWPQPRMGRKTPKQGDEFSFRHTSRLAGA
ncbi:hypothetical protein ACS8Y6_05230 [Salinisphaera sp. RV14]|uniref:hypothetical protein n=1 Tax=Salinisphaera sp. RV14 TaxID=3454140 RepID=UPI003F86AB15